MMAECGKQFLPYCVLMICRRRMTSLQYQVVNVQTRADSVVHRCLQVTTTDSVTHWIFDVYWLVRSAVSLFRFRTEQGHCGACRRKWRLTDTDLCPCGETQTMSDIVESCPLTKLNGGLSRVHSADEDAVSWLTRWFMTRIREEEEITFGCKK